MAVAFGSANTGSVLNNTSLSFSGPSVSGADTIGLLAVYGVRSSGVGTPTWGGVPMTQIGSTISVEGNRKLALFYILNPTAGISTISVSVTSSGSPTNILAIASFYTGVAQSGVPDATASSNLSSVSSITDDLNTNEDGSWVVGAGAETGGSGAISPSTGVTQRASTIGDGSNDSTLAFGDSNAGISPPGNYGMTFTIPSSGNMGIILASLAPSIPPVEYHISGVVSLNGTPVEGAIVRCIRQSDNVAIADVSTDSSGAYTFEDLEEDELYHLAIEYENEGTKYNARSLWDVAPVEVS